MNSTPNISPNFNIEDIHKIREHNYEMTKNMTLKERRQYYKLKADKVREEMLKIREFKRL